MIINKFKRTVILFISLVLTITMFSYQQVNAADTANITLTSTGISYTLSVSATGSIEPYGTINKIYADGVLSLCIDPLVDYGSGTHQQSILATELTANQKDKIKLIDYYAKLMGSETNNKLYATEQLYAWEVITGRTVTSLSNGLTLSEYKSYKAQIDSSIANHSKRPSFNGSNFTLEVGETKTFTDTNGILSKFVYSSSDSSVASVSQSGNTLTITSKKEGKVTLRAQLVNDKYVGTSLVYKKSGYQTKASFKLDDPGQSIVTVTNEISKGSLELGKQDTGGKWIAGTKFNLSTASSTSGLIGNYTTGSNGKVTVSNLNPGTYYYQETYVPSPLLIDATWKKVTIKANEVTTEVAVNKIVMGKIEVNKQSTSGTKIANAKFNIVNSSGSVVDTVTTNANGVTTSKELPLGSYSVIETSVPSPYILDATPIKVDLKYKDQVTPIVSNSVTQKNKVALGKIEVVKYGYNKLAEKLPRSLGDEYIVQGAKFDIKDSTGKIVDSITTGSNGRASSKELPLGKYTVIETFVPSPLVLDETPLEANIVYKDQTTSLVIREVSQRNQEAVGQIEVIKKSIHGDLIEDAVFEVKDKDNQVVETLSTDSKGYAKSKELLLGKYAVTEVSVPDNLVLEKTPITVELTYKNQVTPVVVESTTKINDYQRSDLILSKVENDWDDLQPEFNGLKLSGALLELYARQDIYEGSKKIYFKDELIGEEISDKHGNVSFHNLPIGEYFVKEVEAPNGYLLYDGLWNISIQYDKENPEVEVTSTESTLTNQISYGRSKIHKTGNGGKEFLKDAKFALFTSDGTRLGEFITDAKGEFISPNLRFGKYYWQEIEAPKGYYTDNTKHHFEITVEDHQKIIHLPVDNEYVEMRLQVIKKDIETEKPLKDAIFEIHDENGEVVSFEYANDNLEIQTQSQLITNDKGIAMTRGFLKYGKYSLVEVQAPKGYLKGEPIEFTIDEKTDSVNLPVFGKTKTQEISNEPTTVQIIKLSEKTGEPLEGAHLQLIHKESQEVILDWISDLEPVTFKGLYIDETYILREIKAPEGYFVSEDVEFTVKETRDVQTVTMLDELIPEIKTQAFFEDGDKVNKVDETLTVIDTVSYKDLVVGKEYSLKGKLLDVNTEEIITTAQVIFIPEKSNGEIDLTFTFDASKLLGSTLVIFEDLYRDERLVATHSEITDKKQTVYIPEIKTFASISEFDKATVTITDIVKYSDLETDREHTLKGWIMTEDNKPLLNKDGEIIESSITFTPLEPSGEVEMDFEISLSELSKGKFVVFEALYLDDKLVAEHKDLEDDNQTVTLIELVIEKIDKDTKEHLKGVEFTLYDTDGNKIESNITNEHGEVRFLVPKGKYIVKETQALEGYLAYTKNIKFKVKGSEKDYEIKRLIRNKAVPELPQTGMKSYVIAGALMMLLLGISLSLYAKVYEMEHEDE